MLSLWMERSSPEGNMQQVIDEFIDKLSREPFANALIGKINNWREIRQGVGTHIFY